MLPRLTSVPIAMGVGVKDGVCDFAFAAGVAAQRD